MLKLLNRLNFVEFLLLFFTGFVALSSFSNVILKTVGFNIIEPFLVPIFVYYAYRNGINISKSGVIRIKFLFVFFLTIIGIAIGIGWTRDPFAIITCARPFIYIIIAIEYISKYKYEINIDKLFYLSSGCLIGELVYIFAFSKYIVSSGYQAINIIAIAVCVVVPLIKRQKICSIIGLALSFSASIFSGYRINLVIWVLSIASTMFFIIAFSKKEKKILPLVALLIFSFIIIYLVENIEETADLISNLLHLSKLTKDRIFGRFISFFNGDYTLGDQHRIAGLDRPFTMFVPSIFPQGPIGKIDVRVFGSYTDMPILFFYDLFGSIVTLIFLTAIMFQIIGNIVSCVSSSKCNSISDYRFLSVVLTPIVVCLFFTNGTFLTFVNISILFAFSFGGAFTNYGRKRI